MWTSASDTRFDGTMLMRLAIEFDSVLVECVFAGAVCGYRLKPSLARYYAVTDAQKHTHTWRVLMIALAALMPRQQIGFFSAGCVDKIT